MGTNPEFWHEELGGMRPGSPLYEGQQEYVRREDYETRRIVGVANRIHLTPDMTGAPYSVPVMVSAPAPARHPHLSFLTDLAQSAARRTLGMLESRTLPELPDTDRIKHQRALVTSLRPPLEDSGFLLSDGTFATRKEARAIAIANGQVSPDQKLHPTSLFSEDLW